jgi:hypothetical protein
VRRGAFVLTVAAALALRPRPVRGAVARLYFERAPVPVVKCRAGGRDLLLAIDTGSASSTISPQGAAAFGVSGAMLAGVTLGGTALRAHAVLVGDLGRWNTAAGFALDGALGYEAFRDRAVTFDWRAGVLSFPDLVPDGETAAVTWLRYDERSPQLITFDGLKVDGFPVAAQLDTMMSKTAVIFETKLPDLAIDNAPKAPLYDYAGAPLRGGRVGSLRLGTTTLAAGVTVYAADARAHVPAGDIAMIVGDALFARRALTLDVPNARLIVA